MLKKDQKVFQEIMLKKDKRSFERIICCKGLDKSLRENMSKNAYWKFQGELIKICLIGVSEKLKEKIPRSIRETPRKGLDNIRET